MFRQNDVYMPVIFPDHVTHSTVVIKHAIPVSAGFISLGIVVNCF